MRRPRLLAPLLLLPLLAGCDLVQRPPLADPFGAPYTVLLGAAAGSTSPSPPHVTAEGVLVVAVAYRGGCYEHRFRLAYTLGDDVARLWLVHDDFGDACDGLLEETLSLTLPGAVLARPALELLRPEGAPLPLPRPGGS